jgi:hypothetical protein
MLFERVNHMGQLDVMRSLPVCLSCRKWLTRMGPVHMAKIGNATNSLPQFHAESAFWLLLWWVVNATPAGSDPTEIPIGLWGPLVDTKTDQRSPKISATDVDPAYSPLSELLG